MKQEKLKSISLDATFLSAPNETTEDRKQGAFDVNTVPSLQSFGKVWPVPGDDFLIVPVGGLGRIGMNWTLYGHKGRWLLVDAGIAFAGRDKEDVDCLIPEPEALSSILPKLDGLVVTHAHEDHIGAIAKVWPHRINCPIYATPYATRVIEHRFEEAGTIDDVVMYQFTPGDTLTIGEFVIETVRMTHSVPEPVALAFKTPDGVIFHSGDWKLDEDPLIGETTDFDALMRIGKEGVLALLCDSTNAHKSLALTNEREVLEAFVPAFKNTKGTVVVCCFASNIARVSAAAQAAEASGRHYALAGRSMRTNVEIALDLGMLDHVMPPLAEVRHLKGLDRREKALICTGTQGEERAALARLARGDIGLPLLGRGDTVIISARSIPGNEKEIDAIVDQLRYRDVTVLRGGDLVDDKPVHVSGHAGRNELEALYNLLEPRIAIPVHGHAMHQEAHAELAEEMGAEQVIIAEESNVIAVSRDRAAIIGRVEVPIIELMVDEPAYAPPMMAIA
ncbi:ribonuclease J [Thalassospira xianhensis]|uniref:ribonuclease J n=1 Tax=Thalassospira xianhensis TaxID=478503 RepID=UPI000DEDCC2D|nr:ribonuclease J [Thalassospira xianhensis]